MNREKSTDLNDTTLYIVGDSTVCVYDEDDEYAIPRAGWGMFLNEYTTESAEVENLALSGRSSKSFTQEDNYELLWKSIKPEDYLMIQFGHNDEKNEKEEDIENRYTDPLGDKESKGAFKNYLYECYIKPAQGIGAQVVLITPVARRWFDENGKVLNSHGKWSVAVRELAEELGLPLIDLSNISLDYYNELGVKETKILHSAYYDTEKGDNGLDNTHFSRYGAMEISKLVAEELQKAIPFFTRYICKEKLKKGKNKYTTYGEYVYCLMRVLNKSDEDTESNVNGKQDMTYNGMIDKAKSLGVISGDKFRPDSLFSKQEMLTVTKKAIEILGYDTKLADIKCEVTENKKVIEKDAAAAIMRLYESIKGECCRYTLED